ncbi:MAG: hypothetical protein FWB74_08385, partial [Defluviitaleaceae bacterium]|nr:hypothetical protein [Defluviitaleaceae bacterium]
MKNKKIKNLVIGAVALLAFAFVGGDALARSLAELNRERQEVRDQQAELRAYLRIAQEEQDTILAELIMLDLEMMEATEAYINAQYALEATEQNLYETENRLAEAEAEREARFDILRNRLRFMHENNNLSYIELLLGSHSITEFLNNREHFRRIIEHDHNMISEIAALEEQIAADRDTIELQRLALVEQAAHLEYTMANLDAHMDYRIERLVYIAFAEEQALYNLAQLDTAEQRLSMDIAATQAREAAAAAARRTGSV